MVNKLDPDYIPVKDRVTPMLPRCSKCGHLSFANGGDHNECEFDHIPIVEEYEIKMVARSLNWKHGAFAKKVAKAIREDYTDAKIFKHNFPQIWDKHDAPYGDCDCGIRASLKEGKCHLCRRRK